MGQRGEEEQEPLRQEGSRTRREAPPPSGTASGWVGVEATAAALLMPPLPVLKAGKEWEPLPPAPAST